MGYYDTNKAVCITYKAGGHAIPASRRRACLPASRRRACEVNVHIRDISAISITINASFFDFNIPMKDQSFSVEQIGVYSRASHHIWDISSEIDDAINKGDQMAFGLQQHSDNEAALFRCSLLLHFSTI